MPTANMSYSAPRMVAFTSNQRIATSYLRLAHLNPRPISSSTVTMNIFKLIFVLLLFSPYHLTCALEPIVIRPNGIVKLGDREKQLGTHFIGKTFRTATGIYFEGHQHEGRLMESYEVGYISNDLQEERYWKFKIPVKEFFNYKNVIHLLDWEGNLFILVKNEWKATPWKFNDASEVVYNDKFIITCHPRSPPRKKGEAKYWATGGCSAPEKAWTLTIDWLDVKPKMCNNMLVIRQFALKPPFEVVKINPDNGDEVGRKRVRHRITDMCTVQF